MIKKILGSFIIGLGILNFGFGYTLIENCYTGASSTCNTFDNSWPCLEIENNEEFVMGNYTYKVDNNANFNSSFQGGDYYKSYIFKKTSNSNNYFSYFFRGEDNKLHKVYTRTYRGSSVTFDSGGVCIVNSSNINEIASICGFKVNNPGNVDGCISGIPNVYKGDINEFYNTNGGFDKIYFLPGTDNQGGQYFNGGRFCFTKGNTGYCLYSQFDDLFGKYSDIGTPVIDSTDLSNSKFNIDKNSNDFYESPFNGGNGGGEEEQITIRTGKNYYCPTFKQILENQLSNYNTGLCYNGTLKYENGTITTVQKKDIQTVFTDYEEFTQRINIYYNNCNTPATQSQCENAFNGEREKYSIIANAINNKVDNKGLWNYCNIWLNYDLNATTCTASGYITEQPTTNELIQYIEEIANIGEIMTPNTGNVLDSLIGSGTTRENREELANRDIFGQLDQIKNKITSIFKNRNGINGIIPDYILWLILTTLLLTVLFKK